MPDIENRLGTSTTMNAGMEEETQCEWNWRDSAFCGFLFIFIFILISPLILIRSKKAENGEVKDDPRDFHSKENSPKGIHPIPGKSNTLSFVVSFIVVDLLGLVIS